MGGVVEVHLRDECGSVEGSILVAVRVLVEDQLFCLATRQR